MYKFKNITIKISGASLFFEDYRMILKFVCKYKYLLSSWWVWKRKKGNHSTPGPFAKPQWQKQCATQHRNRQPDHAFNAKSRNTPKYTWERDRWGKTLHEVGGRWTVNVILENGLNGSVERNEVICLSHCYKTYQTDWRPKMRKLKYKGNRLKT